MMMKNLYLFLLFFPCYLKAQKDSSIWLKEIPVASTRIGSSVSHYRDDSLTLTTSVKLSAATVAQQLERESGLFIKSYGPGSIATMSLHGTSASQTDVRLNGLSLQSPMLGLYDLNLIPSYLLGSASLEQGGNSAQYGSGAIAGALLLKSPEENETGTFAEIFSGAGSFGHYQVGAGIDRTTARVSSGTRFYHQESSNNFSYTDSENQRKKLSNSGYIQNGFTQDLRIGTAGSNFSIHLWYLDNDLHIPPLILSNISNQRQEDQALRAVSEWKSTYKNSVIYFRGGGKRDFLRYVNPDAKIDETSVAREYQAEGGINKNINQRFSFGIDGGIIYSEAVSGGYKDPVSSSVYFTVLHGNYTTGRLNLFSAIRQELFNGKAEPLQPSAGLNYELNKTFSWNSQASFTYRNPTLNDLYWKPGGNSLLKPESGYSLITSIIVKNEFHQWSFYARPGLFFIRVKELISWQPVESGIYKAINYSDVISKGAEMHLDMKYARANCYAEAKINIQYNVAMRVPSQQESNRQQLQLPYTPRWLCKAEIAAGFRQWSLHYYSGYTGYRYVTTDHLQFLNPYNYGEFLLSYDKISGKRSTTLFLAVKNCWNESYQVIAWRAMPGRYFETGIKIRAGR